MGANQRAKSMSSSSGYQKNNQKTMSADDSKSNEPSSSLSSSSSSPTNIIEQIKKESLSSLPPSKTSTSNTQVSSSSSSSSSSSAASSDERNEVDHLRVGQETLVPLADVGGSASVSTILSSNNSNTRRSMHQSRHLTDAALEQVMNPGPLTLTGGNNDYNQAEDFEFIDIAAGSEEDPDDYDEEGGKGASVISTVLSNHSIRPPSKATTEALTQVATSQSQIQQQQQQQHPTTDSKIRELSKRVYDKGLQESHTQLLDVTHNFPHFKESEIVFGDVLGKGCFGTVHEIRGFDLETRLEEQMLALATTTVFEDYHGHQATPRRRSFNAGFLIRTWKPDEEVPPGDLESRRFMANHAFRNEGHARYAIKKLSPETLGDTKQLVQGIADLVMEARILAAMEHPNIIKLRAIKAGDRFQPDFFIILDRLYETLAQRIEVWRHQTASGGKSNLFRNLTSRLGVAFRHAKITKESSYQDRLVQAFHLSAAMNYLHRQNIIHRDLKPENIGFDCRGDIKVFDLGMAKEMPHRNPNTSHCVYKFTGMCGSPRYMAPEVAHKQAYNEKCDVYSFAILVYEMLGLQPAYAQHQDFDTMFDQVWGPPYKRPNLAKLKLPTHIHRLIYGAWHYDFHKRPTMQEIADILKDECLTFPNLTLQSLSHRRRKSKVIYDKEQCVFRVNSMLFDGKVKDHN